MYAVIDVGSNSVRLMMHNGEVTISKEVESTKLAEGLAKSETLSVLAMERTAKAIVKFVAKARNSTNKVMIFATEAVRRAVNGDEFVAIVLAKTGIKIHVVTGEEEARLGFTGACGTGECMLIDIGGGSTEVVSGSAGVIEYARSVRIGGVVLRDACGEDLVQFRKFISAKLLEFDYIPLKGEVVAIGGTATTIVAMVDAMEVYLPEKVQDRVLTRSEIVTIFDRVRKMSMERRRSMVGLMAGREDIIVGAMFTLITMMDMMMVSNVKVSERDNLEGYLMVYLHEQNSKSD